MNLDFQTIEAYDVDAENFNCNISDLVDNIFVGPQGELLQNINRFNDLHNTTIGVTKSFTFKPGVYDQVKAAHAKWCLRYDMKPRGMVSLFDRMGQFRWRESNFKRDILAIENNMKHLKTSGMRWQDNSDDFEEEMNKILTSVSSAVNQCREMYPRHTIQSKIIPIDRTRGQFANGTYRGSDRSSFPNSGLFCDDPKDYLICIYIRIPNLNMTVHILDESNRVDQYKVSMGDLMLCSGTFLLPMMSRSWGRTEPLTTSVPNTSYTYFLDAVYLDYHGQSYHPYITHSSDKNRFNLKDNLYGGNICTGNMGPDLRNSLINNEVMAHIVNLITWVSNYYVPQTYPLNRIYKSRMYGDDIQFRMWRNDLNSMSERVFQHEDGNIDMPSKCGFGYTLYDRAINYAKNIDENSHYRRFGSRLNFAVDEPIYQDRMEEYLQDISTKDMPCNNCSFKSECIQWEQIQLFFQEDISPMDEGYIGYIMEVTDYKAFINHSDSNVIRHFAEEYASNAHIDVMVEYDKMMEVNLLTLHLYDKLGQTVLVSSGRLKRRMRTIDGMGDLDRQSLFRDHYNNPDSKFVWCLDDIRSYRAIQPVDAIEEDQSEFNETLADVTREIAAREEQRIVGELREVLNTPDVPEAFPDSEPFAEPEELSAEQRTIQWAIHNGGANNL